MKKNNTIFFDGFQSCFGNGYEIWFRDNEGTEYSSSEQYMMAKKAELFKDEVIKNQILAEHSPDKQKLLGRQIKNFDQAVWNENAEKIVLQAITYKFRQNYNIYRNLLACKDSEFAYLGPDKIWGIGLTIEEVNENPDITEWPGENKLGKILTRFKDAALLMSPFIN